jgi:hypothetical protein
MEQTFYPTGLFSQAETHRTVLVTDQHVYVYRDLPFHRPGAQLGRYPLGRTR